jgi:cytochrome P450
LKFKEWADEYGPIYKIHVFGATVVIISSEKIANELLSMKGSIYSDRPYFPMALEIVTRRGNLLFNGMNEYWRRGRKFAQAQLSTVGVRSWQGIQAAAVPQLVCDLIQEPVNYKFLFERYATIVSLRQGFGKTVNRGPQEESHTLKIISLMHVIEKVGSPFAYLVDIFPILLRAPERLAPFKREGKKLHEQESSYFLALLADARKAKEEGQPEDPPSFARSYLDKTEYWKLSNFEAAYTIGTLYGGGSGTTSSSMQTYCLAMCHYPEWQERLQDEIEQVVGSKRIPQFDDMPKLPTVRAITKEILRWRPVVSGGSPTFTIFQTICANKIQQASHTDLPRTTSTRATLYPPGLQSMQISGPYTEMKSSIPTQKSLDPSAGCSPRTQPFGRR